MALDKKQLLMLIGAVAAGVVAVLVSGKVFSDRVSYETQTLFLSYQKDQEAKEAKYNQQIEQLRQQISVAETRASQAAEQAAQAARQEAEKAAAAAPQKKAQTSLAVKTPAGKRAVTVQIDSLNAVGGLVNPGDFVDVIAHLDVPIAGMDAVGSDKKEEKDEKKSPVTAMIFQKLEILAVNTNIDQPGVYDDQQKEHALKITFAVDPQEAGLLAFADKNGKLELALRGAKDTKRQMLSAATWTTLAEYVLENQGADIQPVKKPEVAPEPVKVQVEPEKTEEVRPYIQIYRGGKEL
ncbi:MAG: Flp pilus assembly protein CpaB [Candidatus Omnitrophica bacterium]|nr:Flp pilus assembly protein CpaB [Candidatus Omnitrophota bacterium]